MVIIFIEHYIVPCIKIVLLKLSVCVSDDEFFEIQSIIRKDYNKFDSDTELIQNLRFICSNIFTYVDSWDDERITYQTYRIFS